MSIAYISVKDVNERIKDLIENDELLNNVIVKGEVASLTDRGHIYFTIKDQDNATLKAVLFRGYQSFVSYLPKVGDEVLLFGKVELYVPNGTYQLIVKDVQLFGEGQRLIELEKLRKKLQSEGLFEESHKLKIPQYPESIAIITARSGAAIHDIIKNILKRYPISEIRFFNSSVQGENAPLELNKALNLAISTHPSVIIIGRGGGDKEDLSAFNDETLVRSIYQSPIPIISAVGHESDYTLVDYVSDLRASTPTDAAIKATPNIHDIYLNLSAKRMFLDNYLSNLINSYEKQFNLYKNHKFFKDPKNYLLNLEDYIKNVKTHLDDKLTNSLNEHSRVLALLSAKISSEIKLMSQSYYARINGLKTKLIAINPKGLIAKGYSLTLNSENKIVTSIKDVKENDILKTHLKDGIITSNVIKKE